MEELFLFIYFFIFICIYITIFVGYEDIGTWSLSRFPQDAPRVNKTQEELVDHNIFVRK